MIERVIGVCEDRLYKLTLLYLLTSEHIAFHTVACVSAGIICIVLVCIKWLFWARKARSVYSWYYIGIVHQYNLVQRLKVIH